MDFLPVSVYKKLPPSLEMVDITGGEPFLRPDIPQIVQTIRATCPKARILITTNGFLPIKIQKYISEILKADPAIAFRVSLDGWGDMHEKIRRVPKAFTLVQKTIYILKKAGVKDVGLTFTLMQINKQDLRTVFDYCRKEHLSFSLNTVHNSPIYYGTGKSSLQAKSADVKDDFNYIVRKQLLSLSPKSWTKAWFNHYSYYYMIHHRRPLPCGAGENFFYMDPFANIFMCQIKNWPIGNLRHQSFDHIWSSKPKSNFLSKAHHCNDCWIMSTAKDAIKQHKLKVMGDVASLIIHGKPLYSPT
jgi:radical SAM protein with 4Fe4S-binding SPASM domain